MRRLNGLRVPAGGWLVVCLCACVPSGKPVPEVIVESRVEPSPKPMLEAKPANDPIACQLLHRCRSEGRCTFDGKACVVASDDDCAMSAQCKWYKQCRAVDGECRRTGESDAACQESWPPYQACWLDGLCRSRDGLCVAATDADCAKFPCTNVAQCKAIDGRCVATSVETCVEVGPDKNGCKSAATCHIVEGRCRDRAVVDEDCLGVGCGHYGFCHAVDGKCIAQTEDDCAFGCEHTGACAVRDGACVAAAPEHCAKAKMCASNGMCHLRHGECVALSDEDCAASSGCKEDGSCSFLLGICTSEDSPASGLL